MLRLFSQLPWFFLWVLCAVACRPAPGPATQAQMRQALERATGLELQLAAEGVRPDSTQRALGRAAGLLEQRTGLPVTRVEGLQSTNASTPRIVLGTFEDPALARLVARFGVEDQDGPVFQGRALRGGKDHWELRGEDPDRPGLPLTIYLGVRWKALEDSLDRLMPGGRPGLTLVTQREGRRELTWRGQVRGLAFHERENWAQPAQLEDERLALHLGAGIPLGRATQYQARAQAALTQVEAWAGAPVTGKLHLYLVEDGSYLHAYSQSSDLAVSIGLRHHRMALMTKGVPHDGGACAGDWGARELLGPAAQVWLQDAAGIDGSGTWWGRELKTWGKHLLGSQLLPTVEQITDPRSGDRLSQHQLRPARGLLFRYLRQTRGAEFVRSLWTGAQTLPMDEDLGAAFEDWVAESGAATLKRRDGEKDAGTFRVGVAMDSNSVLGGGYDGRDLELSLQGAVSTGANALSLTSYYSEVPSWRAANRQWGRQTREGDLSLAQVAAAARHARLRYLAWQPHVLMKDSVGHSAWQRRTSRAHWEEFFAGLEPALVHYALLGELCGVDLLCLGTNLSRRNSNQSLAPEAHRTFTAGWQGAIEAVGRGFSGSLTYAADWDGEAESYPHWEDLDYVGLSFFPRLKDLGTPPPTEAYMFSRWTSLLEQMDGLAASHGKPVLLMEFGARSVSQGANETTIGMGPADPELQRSYYQTLAKALEERRAAGEFGAEQFGGFFAWSWSPRSTDGGPGDRSFHLQGKGASAVLPTLAPGE